MFQRTTAINKLLGMTKRQRVIQGGTYAGKTFGIMAVLINYAAANPRKRITVVAETIPAVKSGALRQFQEIMEGTGRWVESRFNWTELRYSFANRSYIEFKSFDTVGKAKAAGKRDVLFLNEANHIPYHIADILIFRSEEQVWIDFNPDASFWAHTEVLPQPDAEFLLLKYTDNEACPQTVLDQLEDRKKKASTSSYWANWCKVYIDGEVGSLQGAVFPDWKSIEAIPKEAKRIAMGLDWGFAHDPTALIDVWQLGDNIYLDELLYMQGLTNASLVREMELRKISKDVDIIADSADPKSIQDVYDRGYRRIYAATKGEDSVRNGIDKLRQINVFVTSRSVNIWKEQRSYRWKQDKDGNWLPVPEDANNHAMDAVRYVALNRLHQRQAEFYFKKRS